MRHTFHSDYVSNYLLIYSTKRHLLSEDYSCSASKKRLHLLKSLMINYRCHGGYQWSFVLIHTHIQCTPSQPFSLVTCLLTKYPPSNVCVSGFPSIMSHIPPRASRVSSTSISNNFFISILLGKKINLKICIKRFSTASFSTFLSGHV